MFFNPLFENIFQQIPLSLLEFWSSFSFIVGLVLMFFAYGGYTLRPGNKWGIGREWQAWDGVSFLSMGVTFFAIWISGFIGSSFVLVPGAQTFESLKDLSVFLCIVLFGYPALLVVPFAYGLSDFYEGIPLEFMTDWWIGYFINPSCFWLAHQLIGKCPDFRKLRTWKLYALFVGLFMAVEPVLWGFICTGKFTSTEAHYVITPAIFFTTLVTWVMAPFGMLAAYPLSRRLRIFWGDIPGHVKQKNLREKYWTWMSGKDPETGKDCTPGADSGVPIRFFILAPFVVSSLLMMGGTAYFALKSSEEGALRQTAKLHEVISENINLKLGSEVSEPMLRKVAASVPAKLIIVSASGEVISRFGNPGSDLITASLREIGKKDKFHVTLKSARKLSREKWLIDIRPIGGNKIYSLITAMPESYYLAGVRKGQTDSSLIFALGLVLVLFITGVLGAMVITPIRRACHAAHELSHGNLSLRLPESKLAEMNTLSMAFNRMGESLQKSFSDLAEKEDRLTLAVKTGDLGIWEWSLVEDNAFWNENMYRQHDLPSGERMTLEKWAGLLIPEDKDRMLREVRATLKSGDDFHSEFTVKWKDGSLHILRTHGQVLRNKHGEALRFLGISEDITERRKEEKDKAELFEKIASIFLSMRDHTNSPLQALNFSIALLRKRSPEQQDIIDKLETSVQRLSSINRILSRLESRMTNTNLLSENEILDYLDDVDKKASS